MANRVSASVWAGIGSLITAAIVFSGQSAWESLRPTTKSEHDLDISVVGAKQDAILKQLQSNAEGDERRHRHWECDEQSEELEDMLLVPDPTPLDLERIRRIRAWLDDHGCSEFTPD